MRNRLFLVFICLVLVQNFVSARDYNERYYQTKWCKQWGGIQEYKLVDSTRVDCLTQHYAVEFDFAKKWAEGIGQSLYYGLRTGKKPALVLIVETPNDWKYYNKVKYMCEKYGIKLWYMTSPNYYADKISHLIYYYGFNSVVGWENYIRSLNI